MSDIETKLDELEDRIDALAGELGVEFDSETGPSGISDVWVKVWEWCDRRGEKCVTYIPIQDFEPSVEDESTLPAKTPVTERSVCDHELAEVWFSGMEVVSPSEVPTDE